MSDVVIAAFDLLLRWSWQAFLLFAIAWILVWRDRSGTAATRPRSG
jgi:hypothetical protein